MAAKQVTIKKKTVTSNKDVAKKHKRCPSCGKFTKGKGGNAKG